MEIIAPFCILVVIAVIFAAVISSHTHHWESGRAIAIGLGFFSPFLFATYLIVVSNKREDYHRSRAEAYCSDGLCSAPLGHDYFLSYFDEQPQDASIAMAIKPMPMNPLLSNVDKISLKDPWVAGHVLNENGVQAISSPYFTLDTSTGVLHRFANEAAMRNALPATRSLEEPEALFDAISTRQRSFLFWECALIPPLLIAFTGWWFVWRPHTLNAN